MSAFGPSVRSISALGTRNGRTLPTHGAGSSPKLGGVGRQAPGVVPKTKRERSAPAIVRARREHRRCAGLADLDPAGLCGPVGHARERCVIEGLERRLLRRENADEGPVGGGRRGRLLGIRRIGRGRGEIRSVASVDRVDGVVDSALHHRQAERLHVRGLARGRGADAAIAFQSVTALLVDCARAAGASASSAAAATSRPNLA